MDPVATKTKEKLQKVLDVLKDDLATIRTGRATPSLVEHIVISAYGGSAKLKVMELATIATPDNQTIVLTPFDASITQDLQKGIEAANAGLTPVIDGTSSVLKFPRYLLKDGRN